MRQYIDKHGSEVSVAHEVSAAAAATATAAITAAADAAAITAATATATANAPDAEMSGEEQKNSPLSGDIDLSGASDDNLSSPCICSAYSYSRRMLRAKLDFIDVNINDSSETDGANEMLAPAFITDSRELHPLRVEIGTHFHMTPTGWWRNIRAWCPPPLLRELRLG